MALFFAGDEEEAGQMNICGQFAQPLNLIVVVDTFPRWSSCTDPCNVTRDNEHYLDIESTRKYQI